MLPQGNKDPCVVLETPFISTSFEKKGAICLLLLTVNTKNSLCVFPGSFLYNHLVKVIIFSHQPK
jgi:hypothetical protein